MEAVNNLASSASRAIWGTSNTAVDSNQTSEPVAGETGNVQAGEPYDKGNLDSTDTDLTSTAIPGEKKDTTFPSTTTASENPSTSPLKQYQAPWQDNDAPTSANPSSTATTTAPQTVPAVQTAKGGDVQSSAAGLVRDVKDPMAPSPTTTSGTTANTNTAAAIGTNTSADKDKKRDENTPSIAKASSRPDTTALPVSAASTPAKGGEPASPTGLQKAGSGESAGSGKEKVSLKEKIKAKLHKSKE